MENQVEVPYSHLMFHGYGGGDQGNFYTGDHHEITSSSTNFLTPYGFSSTPVPPIPAPLYPIIRPHDHQGAAQGYSPATSSFLYGTIHAELGKMSAQQIMDAKALAASKSHSEAERRRRERINGHLAKLRSMLPNTTKTDKASLLAEVIQHVKELKRQTSEIAGESPLLPTESDEITVSSTCGEDGKFVVQASVCCDDRSDLLPDLIRALKALKLRPLKAEITTVAGRVKNVLLVAGEDAGHRRQCVAAIRDALNSIVEQAAAAAAKQDGGGSSSASGGSKRQRTSSLST